VFDLGWLTRGTPCTFTFKNANSTCYRQVLETPIFQLGMVKLENHLEELEIELSVSPLSDHVLDANCPNDTTNTIYNADEYKGKVLVRGVKVIAP